MQKTNFFKLIIFFLIILLGCLILNGCSNKDDNKDILTEKDFKNIKIGTSINKVEEKLGLPNLNIGSGLSRYVYKLKKGYAIIYFNLNDEVKRIEFVDDWVKK